MITAPADVADADDEALLTAGDEDKDEEKDAMDEDWHSITEPIQPLTNDRSLFTVACLALMRYSSNIISSADL